MKKMIVLFALSLALVSARSYASTGPRVPAPVSTEFNQYFAHAREVRWEAIADYFKATFAVRGRTLFAFFTDNGNLMGIAANVSSDNLPADLRAEIKKSYAGYWITDLFGYHNADENGFVVTLENADRTVVLKSVDHGGWSIYRTSFKN
jgi:hypothetical protein